MTTRAKKHLPQSDSLHDQSRIFTCERFPKLKAHGSSVFSLRLGALTQFDHRTAVFCAG
jgi:hypothetical protein